MKNLLNYSSAYAILGRLRSDSLTVETVRDFLNYSSNQLTGEIPQIIRSEVLDNVYIQEKHNTFPANLQYYLLSRQYLLTRRLTKFIRGKTNGFLQTFPLFLLFYTLRDLARQIIKGENFHFANTLFFELTGEYFTLSEESSFSSVDSLLKVTSDSDVNDILALAVERYKDRARLFDFEMALDIGYLKLLWKRIGALGAMNRSKARMIIGPYIAGRILKWSLELKDEYEVVPARIFNYMFFPKPFLTESAFWEYIEREELNEWIEALPMSKFSRYLKSNFSNANGDTGLVTLDRLVRRFQWGLVKHRPIGYPFTVLTFIQYIINQEIIIKDLIYIAEAKRFDKEQKEIREHLVTLEPTKK